MTVKSSASKSKTTRTAQTTENDMTTAVLAHVAPANEKPAPTDARKAELAKAAKRARRKRAEEELVELFPHGISMATTLGRPTLVLKDRASDETLPVWMQPLDAGVALQELTNQAATTPHAVVRRLFEALRLRLESCTFTELTGHHQFVDLVFASISGQPATKVTRVRADEAMSFCLHGQARFYCTKKLMARCREIDFDINKFEHHMEIGLLPELRAEMEAGVKKHPYLM